MKKLCKTLFVSLMAIRLWSCEEKPRDPAVIIPQPVRVSAADGTFRLGAKTLVDSNLGAQAAADLWTDAMPGKVSPKTEEASVRLTLDKSGFGSVGSYRLEITPERVEIKASTREGLFYGVQSLRQLHDAYGRRIPCAVIDDTPRFASRGLLLDVSRHYLPVDFIRRLLDMMAYLKMNRFVWYLGGDGGWRLEIPSCPRLTDRAAWRTEAEYARWKESDGGFCPRNAPGAYGGYYTESDVRGIIEYARRRFIDVVPAFDLPCAHHKIADAVGLECRSGTEGRSAETGVTEVILSTVVEWFNPQFVYLGNGQADHVRGSFCLECLPRVEEGRTGDMLDSRHAYALYEAENFLSERGVRLMAWEESLRGVLTRDAAVVAWGKAAEGITAAGMGYDAILSSSAYASLDYYQDDPATDPLPSPGFLPLETLYAYDPVARDAPSAVRDHVLGVQANLWTPYIRSGEEAEYKLYPRLFAVAESGWTYPQRKSIYDFRRRTVRMSHVLRKKGYHCFDIVGERGARPESDLPVKHLAWGCPVTYRIPVSRQFPGLGAGSLTDGQRGGWSFDDGRWQGFMGTDMDVVIDLGAPCEVRSVSADFMNDPAARIRYPMRVDVYASDDGIDFSLIGSVEGRIHDGAKAYAITSFAWGGRVATRYIRYTAIRGGGHAGSWMFTDEIVVR